MSPFNGSRFGPLLFPGRAISGLLLCLAAGACFSLSEQEKVALDGYKHNSKAYYNSGKYGETIDQCLKGLELDEDDYSLNLTLAWARLRSGTKPNLFEAYNQFKKTDSLRWFNDDFRISLGLGETCYKIAMVYRQRLDYFERKIEEDANTALLFEEEIEECREGMERYLEEAIEYLQDTLAHERERENIEAILTLGQAYAYDGEHELAVQYLNQGLDLLESSTTFQQKQLEGESSITGDGRRFFERQVRRNLRWEKELRGILAFVYRRMGELDNALMQYNLLEERELFDDVQHYNRAIVLQELGRYQEAIEEYDRFLRRASLSGREFDEDEHFHLAIQKQEECRNRIKQAGGTAASEGAGSSNGDA
jgi:tetratricopeptide (TPR) repeat protein